MRRLRAGPQRDAAIQRIRERWTADEEALGRAPFPIVGLAPPFPSPVSLGTLETGNGQVLKAGLLYGAPGPPSGRQVSVCTAAAPPDPEDLSFDDLLNDLLREFEGDGEDPPPDVGAARRAEVLLDGVQLPMHALEHGAVSVAVAAPRLDDVTLLVTVATRGLPLSEVALTRVDDLEPFLTGRRERIEAALARAGTQPGPEDWDLPPASGLAGHQALARAMIATTQARMAPGHAARGPSLGSEYAQRWEVATRAQMELAGQQRDQAEDEIHSMINHLCQLAQSANWFSSPDLADKAIAETLDHVAYLRDVPSGAAQQAWSRYWSLHGQEPPAFETLSSAKQSWLAAWEHWVEHS
jgi:hypothetical protein